jgi:hypothetical protein
LKIQTPLVSYDNADNVVHINPNTLLKYLQTAATEAIIIIITNVIMITK